MAKIGKLKISLLILLNVCAFSRPVQAETSIYVFGSDQSTVVKTGGFAGVHETYAVTGQFRLTVNLDSRIASFEIVDANLTDDTVLEYGQSLNEIFNMTELAGTVVNYMTIEFEGKTADGTESDVSLSLKLIIKDDSVHLTGKTTPPPNSADMFIYDVNAVATKKYEGGAGEPNDPYQIATAEDLIALGETPADYDKHFILTADIDLDPNLPGRKVFDRAVIAPDTNDVTDSFAFEGIPFTGIFDGNGCTISRLTIIGESYLGLFGRCGLWDAPAGEVKYLNMVDVNIVGTGGCVGAVTGSNGGSVTRCFSTGTVVGGGAYVGGLVGINVWPGVVTCCYSTATIRGNDHVGGLAGSNGNLVMNCYSTCAVTAVGENAGGLVGWNRGDVTDCYSRSVVSGGSNVGGLVGMNTYNVIRCYCTGAVSGSSYVGGLVGRSAGWGKPAIPVFTTASLWDTDTSGQPGSDGGMGKTTAEMQMLKTFLEAGWDFVGETENGIEDIWSICEGTNYPRFVWQIPVVDFVCPDGITVDDFSFFMEHWLDDNCDLSNGYCQGTDLDQSGTVDVIDLEIFFENWLAEL